MRTRYRIHDDLYPHFLTCTVVGWLPVFTRPECVEVVLSSWQYLCRSGRLTLYGYVVLENHLHFIASGDRLSETVGDFKSFTARKVVDFLHARAEGSLLDQLAREKAAHKTDRRYQLWQEGSHPQQIESDDVMVQKLEYIHNNPVARGYVDVPEHWRYSSARDYLGQPGLIDVTTDWR